MIQLFLLAAAAQQPAPAAATWRIEGAPGSVRSITADVKSGGRLVADGFVGEAEAVSAEKQELSGDHAPAGSCAHAAKTRPFTRLRRFTANGRLLWTWTTAGEQQAMSLLSGWPGDCLSPDGGRLLVTIYRFSRDEPVSEMGGAVVAVDRRPRFVEVKGAKTGQSLDDLRKFSSLGWRRGADATLMFTLYDQQNGRETPDRAVLGRRP